MANLNEIKNQIKNSSDWVKIGAKKGNPALSIFPEDIQQELIDGNYVIGKSYIFSDSDTKYKITTDGKVFLIFAKPINTLVQKSSSNKVNSKSFIDMQMLFIIIALGIVTLASIILVGPIFHALGW